MRTSIERGPKSVQRLSPCHYALDARTFLNLYFHGRWIGRAGHMMWQHVLLTSCRWTLCVGIYQKACVRPTHSHITGAQERH